MDVPEIEDPALEVGNTSGFLIDLKSDERLERWKNFGEEKSRVPSPASEEREREKSQINSRSGPDCDARSTGRSTQKTRELCNLRAVDRSVDSNNPRVLQTYSGRPGPIFGRPIKEQK